MIRATVAVDTAAEVEEAVSEEAEADATWMKLFAVLGWIDEHILE